MRKLILLMAFVASVTTLCAQNGGQANENNSVRIEFAGATEGKAVIKAYNKQGCAADIKVSVNNVSFIKTIAANASDTFQFAGPFVGTTRIQAKTQTNCGSADFGNVELSLELGSLPIKFRSVVSKRLAPDLIEITFDVEEAEGINYYNVQVSRDGRRWKTYTVVFPDTTRPNTVYKIKIKI